MTTSVESTVRHIPLAFPRAASLYALAALLVALTPVLTLFGQDSDAAAADPLAGVDHAEVTVNPDLWVLNFQPRRLKTISLLDGPFKGRIYWYMVYTIENKSEDDREVFLAITATSDRNKSYTDVQLASVERAVERSEGQPLWGKTDALQEQSERDPADPKYYYTVIKAGEKRECVAVFNQLDPGANNIAVNIRGLSNDFNLIENDDGSRVIEERILRVRYSRPKDEYEINLDRFMLLKKEWVKRRVPLVIPEPR